jgi:uncharacterized protein (DUF1800 family)
MKRKSSLIGKPAAFLMLLAIFTPSFSIGVNAQQMAQKTKVKPLNENQKILHVLNRLGFGARPGDVERVKSIGINKYIEQQLNPSSITDSVAEAKVKNLDIITMSNEEIFAKYPSPQAVLQAVAQENNLGRKDLKGLREKNKNVPKANEAMSAGKGEMANGEMAIGKSSNKNADVADISPADRQKYQQQVNELYRKYELGRPQQISQQLNASRILRAVYSERQLNEAMVDFWTNHFNVYAGKAATRWLLPGYDRDVIRPNALGNFKDLLLATAKSPAMLFYLDNYQSVSPDASANNGRNGNARLQRQIQNGNLRPRARQRLKEKLGATDEQLDQKLKEMRDNPPAKQPKKQQRGINENYAREVMELHTLGVEGGYTQKDIQEVARAFTGWTIIDPRGYRRSFAKLNGIESISVGNRLLRQMNLPEEGESGSFYFNERWHDAAEKTVLGQKINEGGMKDGLKVIDILVNHPSTAKFIARKLAVKFVSDNPSEALVSRVADAFHKSKGDIKTTLRALFTDKEFFAPENYRAKIKTPFEVVVSAVRTLGAETNGRQIQALLAKMGEPLYGYQAPTGYPDTAEDWVNTGALLERLNFAIALSSNRIPGTRVDLKKFEAKGKAQILDQTVAAVLDGEISNNTKASLLKQIEQPLPEVKISNVSIDTEGNDNASMNMMQGGGKRGRVPQARMLAPSGNAEVFKVVGLILGTPEFQRQ